MLFLWLFAKSLEDTLGRGRFLALFLISRDRRRRRAGAVRARTRWRPRSAWRGRSQGLIGAYALLYPRARILCWVLIPFFVTFVEIPSLILAAVWLALQASRRGRPATDLPD